MTNCAPKLLAHIQSLNLQNEQNFVEIIPAAVKTEKFSFPANILAILTQDGPVNKASKGTQAYLILDKTIFYAEKGGQHGDTGTITTLDNAIFSVEDVQYAADWIIHIGNVTEGELSCPAEVQLLLDWERRQATRRAHTAQHLVDYYLRMQTTDTDCRACDSASIFEDRFRMEMQRSTPLPEKQIEEIEAFASSAIENDWPVKSEVMLLSAAKADPTIMGWFEEKYPEKVKVVEVGKDREICCGTHLNSTGEIQALCFVSDIRMGKGKRKVSVFTGKKAQEAFLMGRKLQELLVADLTVSSKKEVESILKDHEVPIAIKNKAQDALVSAKKKLAKEEKEVEERQLEALKKQADKFLDQNKMVSEISVSNSKELVSILMHFQGNSQPAFLCVDSGRIEYGLVIPNDTKKAEDLVQQICTHFGGKAWKNKTIHMGRLDATGPTVEDVKLLFRNLMGE
eukprot:GHVP01055214.1.p1 GENE.GHVP01055214.1~~GHVP01055214.1.p1  ORF type:complete len:462 (+),score=99.70 GHVP01055214.1:24-1388(+)